MAMSESTHEQLNLFMAQNVKFSANRGPIREQNGYNLWALVDISVEAAHSYSEQPTEAPPAPQAACLVATASGKHICEAKGFGCSLTQNGIYLRIPEVE